MKGRLIWTWTLTKLGMTLRMDSRHISPDWLIRPAFQYWLLQRQAALLWIIAHLVYYRLQTSRRLSLKNFMDFLRRARWKAYHRSSKRPTLAGTWTSSDAHHGAGEWGTTSRGRGPTGMHGIPQLPGLPCAWAHSPDRPTFSHFFLLTAGRSLPPMYDNKWIIKGC